jgi:hypothetical protein
MRDDKRSIGLKMTHLGSQFCSTAIETILAFGARSGRIFLVEVATMPMRSLGPFGPEAIAKMSEALELPAKN